MNWMQRLERVFAIAIQNCQRCGAALRVVASIEDPTLIQHILAYRGRPQHSLIACGKR